MNEQEKWEFVKDVCVQEKFIFSKIHPRLNEIFDWTEQESYIATEQFYKSSLNPDYVNYN